MQRERSRRAVALYRRSQDVGDRVGPRIDRVPIAQVDPLVAVDATEDCNGLRSELWDLSQGAIELTARFLVGHRLVAPWPHREHEHGHRLQRVAFAPEEPPRVAVQPPSIQRSTHHDALVAPDVAHPLPATTHLDADTASTHARRDRVCDLTGRAALGSEYDQQTGSHARHRSTVHGGQARDMPHTQSRPPDRCRKAQKAARSRCSSLGRPSEPLAG